MTEATVEQKRHNMRLRAEKRVRDSKRPRRRKKVKPLKMSAALFAVRRSEILLFLSRNEGRRVDFQEIAHATGVPLSAVRKVCRALSKEGNDLMPAPETVGPEAAKANPDPLSEAPS